MAELLRPDIAAAAARLSSPLGTKKEIRALVRHLLAGERVDAVVPGMLKNGNGLLALTDRRLLFLRDGWAGQALEQFPLLQVGSIVLDPGMVLAKLSVHAGGQKLVFSSVPKSEGADFVERVRVAVSAQLLPSAPVPGPPADPFAKRAPAPAPAPAGGDFPAVIEQLRQLAELRDAAVITIADFKAKKAELLARI